MERLCDEVLHLIFVELADPSPLTLVSKRFNRFSQDPYVRAHYFLTRYGPIEAMFYALGRGRIITERVLDILLTSGAHISRYLVQVAIHHYFYTQSHFIKTAWVRNIPLRVFLYFLKTAEDKYGEIPRGKGEDDGSLFSSFLKESRLPTPMKSISWETVRDILDKYHFIPFCSKDPIMAQFPLALAIEPRLLPFAVQNGFHMDNKYRDFVFRKMFEKPSLGNDSRAEDIVQNVRELCRLDSTMFLSRTVVAEVCMEAKSNEVGFSALKQLDKSGDLRFELGSLIEDLIKTFLVTRSISHPSTIEILRYLYSEFPSSDPKVRLVILITIFVTSEHLHSSPSAIHAKLENLGLTPVSRNDVLNILINPFINRYQVLLDYARTEVGVKPDGTKGMSPEDVVQLIEDVVAKCLEVSCKGNLLKKLCEGFPGVHDMIERIVLGRHQLQLRDVPSWEDGDDRHRTYETRLCRDYLKVPLLGPEDEAQDIHKGRPCEQQRAVGSMDVDDVHSAEGADRDSVDLGPISQESLTTMIRQDEIAPVRSRRRLFHSFPSHGDTSGKLHYPADFLQVGRWIKNQFGAKSAITAVFLTHAIVNENGDVFKHYLVMEGFAGSTSSQVPITLKHFQSLARLGRAPSPILFQNIEWGAQFYTDENDYLSKADMLKKNGGSSSVKKETSPPVVPVSSSFPEMACSSSQATVSPRGHKRPRRSAAAVRSYVVPDSDDEAIIGDGGGGVGQDKKSAQSETNLQKWIKHLGILAKEEQRKYKEQKRRIEMAQESGTKVRVAKTDFLKSLLSNLRNLRRLDANRRFRLYGPQLLVDGSSDDDDEYNNRANRPKRRKSLRSA